MPTSHDEHRTVAEQIEGTIGDLFRGLRTNGGFTLSDVRDIINVKGNENLLNCIPSMRNFYESLYTIFNSNKDIILRIAPNTKKTITSIASESNKASEALKKVKPEKGLESKSFGKYKEIVNNLINAFTCFSPQAKQTDLNKGVTQLHQILPCLR